MSTDERIVEALVGQSVRSQIVNVGMATGFLRCESAEHLAAVIEPIVRERIEAAVIQYAGREPAKLKLELSEGDHWFLRKYQATILRDAADEVGAWGPATLEAAEALRARAKRVEANK